MGHLTDLTPEEARAEVEAFMGEGWLATAWESDIVRGMFVVKAHHGDIVVGAMKDTYRAGVDALKQAWRDAVRPWVRKADEQAFDEGVAYERSRKTRTTKDGRVSRVLKEDQ